MKEPAFKLQFHNVNLSGTGKIQLRQDKLWLPCKLNRPKVMMKDRLSFSFPSPVKGLECCNAEILLHVSQCKFIYIDY